MITRQKYIHAVVHLRQLLDAVEVWLETLPDDVPVRASHVRTVERKHVATQDEAAVIIAALLDVGILSSEPPLRLSRQVLVETMGYRRGVREMLEAMPTHEKEAQICATLPTGLATNMADTFHENVLDLRAVLFDLLASAHSRVLIASPFWDSTTANELAELLRRRLSSGVHVDILGRADKKGNNDYMALTRLFTEYQDIRFYTWYEPNNDDLFGSQTFHFKAVVIDNGAKAYIGSANMTSGGLRSRMELGVVLQGNTAVTVATILDEVLRIATRI
jgi:phosphatidylserine/phosphatidylglycerophosphate/cardiolipin synthase-like enzyme